MQTRTPGPAQVLTMVLFALSCFGLLLFLWLSFGGPVPLKPKGYRVQVAFPEATQLGLEADVRVAGVSVGKVRQKELDPAGNRTLATLELDRRYAPIRSDAKAILRQKTLLGETYVELTPGKSQKMLPEDGRLANAQVAPTVELDEIFSALDPKTREAFRTWQQDLAKQIEGHGRDLNDALGSLPRFVADGADLMQVLDTQQGALRRMVRNTGVVFNALGERQDQLRNLVTGSGRVFDATASQNEALGEAIQIFPTFLDESKATLARLETFSKDTHPLVRDLTPVARDLQPTLRSTRELAPDLRRFFNDLDPLITVSKRGLPALRDTLDGAKPLLSELGPFLGQLNPILGWLELHQHTISDFFTDGGAAVADTTSTATPGALGHYLRQFGPVGAETAAVWPERLPSNRGNSYLPPLGIALRETLEKGMLPSFDCNNTGGEVPKKTGTGGAPACFVAPPPKFQGKADHFTRIEPGSKNGASR
jgi:phospholipid/cholesterol/gamma-HCH transport system substrate-binding protein